MYTGVFNAVKKTDRGMQEPKVEGCFLSPLKGCVQGEGEPPNQNMIFFHITLLI